MRTCISTGRPTTDGDMTISAISVGGLQLLQEDFGFPERYGDALTRTSQTPTSLVSLREFMFQTNESKNVDTRTVQPA